MKENDGQLKKRKYARLIGILSVITLLVSFSVLIVSLRELSRCKEVESILSNCTKGSRMSACAGALRKIEFDGFVDEFDGERTIFDSKAVGFHFFRSVVTIGSQNGIVTECRYSRLAPSWAEYF